jgi:hypothetical protein
MPPKEMRRKQYEKHIGLIVAALSFGIVHSCLAATGIARSKPSRDVKASSHIAAA